ncbi:MAG: glycosyltransferase [Bacteroidota bacterium]
MGVFMLPDILAQLPEHVRLHILGSGSAQGNLKDLFEKAGLTDRVKWYGNVPQRQVMVQLQRMSALIVPSYLEPQGRVLLEAMSAGTPVVASDIPGINDYVKHRETGLLFPKGNVAEAVSAISTLLHSPELIETLGKNGQQFVQAHLTWDIVARQTIEIYQQACQ